MGFAVVRGPPSGRSSICGRPALGAKLSGTEPAPFAAGRASHRKARDLHDAAPCTGSICGRPALGPKLFGHRAGAIRRGSRLPQKSVRPAQRSAMHGLNLWEAPTPERSFGAEPAPFAAGRGSHRKACDLRNAAPCTGSIFGRPALGAKLWAPSWRHSPRVAAPTEKRATCTTQRHARAQFVGGPPSGRSFSGSEPAPFAAGRGSYRKSASLHKATPGTGSICGRPALGAKLFGHRSGAIRRGSRLPQKMRATRAMRCHALTAFVGGPPSGRSCSSTEPVPFAAGRPSHRKARGLHKAAPPARKNRRRGSAGQCGGYCDSTSVTAWRNTPVRSCGLPGSSRSIRSELPRQTSLPSFAS